MATQKRTLAQVRAQAKKMGIPFQKNGKRRSKTDLERLINLAKGREFRQTQKGKSNARADEARKALPPGKRRSASGTTYYERRANRSDVPGSLTDNNSLRLCHIEEEGRDNDAAFVVVGTTNMQIHYSNLRKRAGYSGRWNDYFFQGDLDYTQDGNRKESTGEFGQNDFLGEGIKILSKAD